MPITRAWRRCPHAIYLPVNYNLYKKVSSRIMNILRSFAGKFEQWGLDEAFLDVTSKVNDLEEANRLAQKIKQKIYAKEKLTCSIGIGPNKLVAKIASDFNKPDGLTVIDENDVKSFLAPLPVEKLLWIGKKTRSKLNSLGIKTIGDLANFDASILIDKFGVMGRQMHLSAKGIDRSEVQEQWEIKSMSRDTTFDEDTLDTKLLSNTFDALAEDIHKQLLESNFNFKTITIKIRYENFETHSHSKTLPFMTARLTDIQKTVDTLMQAYLQPDRKVRLIGLKLSNLVSGKKQKKLI